MRLRIPFARDGHVEIVLRARLRFFAERLAACVWAAGIGPLSIFVILPERHPWPPEMHEAEFD